MASRLGPLDLDPHGRPHAALQHDQPRADGLQLGRRGGAGQFGRPDDLAPDVVLGADFVAPLAEVPAAAVGDQPPVCVPREGIGVPVVAESLPLP